MCLFAQNRKIKSAVFDKFSDRNFTFFILQTLPNFIKNFQDIRNESVHGKSADLKEVKNIRNKILGIKKSSFLNELLYNKYILTVS